MKMHVQLLATLLVLGIGQVASADAETEGQSPSGKINWELKESSSEGEEASLWLTKVGTDGNGVKLCETVGSGSQEVTISPDDYWIAVTDGGGSLGIDIRLFRRTKGLNYKEQEQTIAAELETLALASGGYEEDEPVLDHQYTRVLHWSPDSKFILLRTTGHAGSKYKITPFHAIYDVGEKSFSEDLSDLNAGSAKPNKD